MNRLYGDSTQALNAISTASIPRSIDVSSADYLPVGKEIKNIHVATPGDLEIIDLEDNTTVISNWSGWLDCGAKSILSANTTASGITVFLTT